MNTNRILCGIALLLCTLSSCASAYKILGILPTASASHYIVGTALLRELARRGHEVTIVSPFPMSRPVKNILSIDTPKVHTAMDHVFKNHFDPNHASFFRRFTNFHNFGINIARSILEENSVQELLHSNKTFDAVICEVFLSEALFGFAEHFKAPLIGLSTFGATAWSTDMVGSPSPPSYVPHPMLPFTDHMSLIQRIGNLAFITFERFLLEFYYLPKQAALYKQFFPNAKRDMYKVRSNAALVLVNQHVSLSSPRPYVPNQIEVGGMHINRQINPLPADIKKFIDESKHGVIYFSMGSNLRSKELPLEKRKAILDTFRGLKQRVLWKFQEPSLPGKPNNVFISDWFPQNDILAHPNVKLFITHGGLLSMMESIYHGKPLIGIPIFGDQFLNMARAESNGYGIMLDYNNLTTKSFTQAIQRMINEPKYTQLVSQMSQRYRDQPMQPMDLAVFWIEHVARHKGAKYLHCAGLDLNFIQYHNLDAIVILYGGLVVLLLVITRLLWVILRQCFKKKPTEEKKHN